MLEEVLELDPTSVEGHQRLARLLASQGLIREAISVAQRALLNSPDHLQTLINLGQLLRMDNRAEEALPYLERAEARRTKAVMRSALPEKEGGPPQGRGTQREKPRVA